ncbi:hypothetical protein DFQ28_004189, partial [Apophysomyces sp. BC1034]
MDQRNIQTYASLDIETSRDLPGNYGFVSGAEAASRERIHLRSKKATAYHVAYVTFKEMRLFNEFVRSTDHFNEAGKQSLQKGTDSDEKYSALQDVFQRFGYYYPSTVRLGGLIIWKASSEDEKGQHFVQGNSVKSVVEDICNVNANANSALCEVTDLTEVFGRVTTVGDHLSK